MPRKLKTYRTTAGFFDLAIAAPSMKAALDAWGAGANLFQQGFASVTDDPAIVKATRAKPGVVLRRAVGSTGAFREHADLPMDLPVAKATRTKTTAAPSRTRPDSRAQEREERAAQKERERRRLAIATAETALDDARRAHDTRRAKIDSDRATIDQRAEAEESQWRVEKERLELSVRLARELKLDDV